MDAVCALNTPVPAARAALLLYLQGCAAQQNILPVIMCLIYTTAFLDVL